MPRTLSTATQNALGATITSVGYLVDIVVGATTLRLCDIGPVTWNGNAYTSADMKISGAGFSADSSFSGDFTISLQNLDNVAGLLFTSVRLADCSVTVRQFERSAIAVADPALMATMAISGADIGIDRVTLRLVASESSYLFAPRKRVDAAHGFKFATPDKTRIVWGYEVFIVNSDA